MSHSIMSVRAVRSRALLLWAVLLSSLFMLSACGGGGSSGKNKSSSSSNMSSNTPALSSTAPVLSSAAASSDAPLVSSSSAATQTSSDASSSQPAIVAQLSGRVAVGAALANATVIARCSDGSGFAVPVITDMNGSYQGTIPDSAVLPCALQARGGDPEVVLHSYASAPGTINITTLTDLLIASASGELPEDWFDSSNWQSVGAGLASAQSELALQLVQSGYTLDSNAFAPFTTPFAIGDAHDRIMDRLQEAIDADGTLTSYEDLIARILAGDGFTEIPAVPDTKVTATSVALLVNNGAPTLRVTGTVNGTHNSDVFLRIRSNGVNIDADNSSIAQRQFSADVDLTQLTQAGIWYDVLLGVTSTNSLSDLPDSLANMGQTITVNNRVYSFKEWQGQLKVNFDDVTASSSSSSTSSSASSAATSVTPTSVSLLVNNGAPTLRVSGTVSGTNSDTYLCVRTSGNCVGNVTNGSMTAGQFSADFDLSSLANDIWYDLLVGVTGADLTDLNQTLADMAQAITVDDRLYEFKEYNGDLKVNVRDVSVAVNATAVALVDVGGVPTLRVTGNINGTSNGDVYLSIRTNGETYDTPNSETTPGLFSADFDPAVLTQAGTWYDIVLGVTSKNTLTSIPDSAANMSQTLSKDGRTYEFKEWDHWLKINFNL